MNAPKQAAAVTQRPLTVGEHVRVHDNRWTPNGWAPCVSDAVVVDPCVTKEPYTGDVEVQIERELGSSFYNRASVETLDQITAAVPPVTDQQAAAVTGAYVPDIVLYHANCADGFGAAWACWMRWRDACQYRPASYGETPPDVTGKHVLLVDFSYKRDLLDQLAHEAASIVILDHHKTARDDLAPFACEFTGRFSAEMVPAMLRDLAELNRPPIAALFDMNKSGARLAWEFCHDSDAPDLVTLIEDRDLWRFTDDRTKPFSLWLRARPFDFTEWEMISQKMGDASDSHRIMTEAAAMQTLNDQIVADIASRARPISVVGFVVPSVDCPPNFASEVCHALLVKNPEAPFAAAYSDNPNGKRGWSLRSQDHRQDVSEIAKRFGGGGHRNAAGFGMPIAVAGLEPRLASPAVGEVNQDERDLAELLAGWRASLAHPANWLPQLRTILATPPTASREDAGADLTLAGVEAETKRLIQEAAGKTGMSISDWIARRMREAAERALAASSQPSAGEVFTRITREQYPEIIQAARWIDDDNGTPHFEPGIGFVVDDPEGLSVPVRWLPHLPKIEVALAGLDHVNPHPLDVDTIEYLAREGKEPGLHYSAVYCFVSGEHTPMTAMAQSSAELWAAHRFFNERFEGWQFDPAAGWEEPAALPASDGLREAIRAEIINTPETADFMAGVPLEAAHQRERWGASHDGGKTPFDWFWLIGYLAQKAASAQVADDDTKALHHTISTAAALSNWHAQIAGRTNMRPGIGPDSPFGAATTVPDAA